MKRTTMYTKEFSDLGILQEAATICYNLLEETEAVPLPYGIELVEKGMSEKEATQEAPRCLRCDHFGYGVFKGGRVEEW